MMDNIYQFPIMQILGAGSSKTVISRPGQGLQQEAGDWSMLCSGVDTMKTAITDPSVSMLLWAT